MGNLQEKKDIITKERSALKSIKEQKIAEINKINQRMIELEGQNKLLDQLIQEQPTLAPTQPTGQTKEEGPKANSKEKNPKDAQK